MLGIMSSRSALELAADQGLDLVKISPTAVPPVCKIIDYGKYLFNQKKREKEDSKKQSVVELKEIQLSATIDVGDMKTKANQTAKFLSKGNKIKIALRLKADKCNIPTSLSKSFPNSCKCWKKAVTRWINPPNSKDVSSPRR